jgi:hypothetical protein
VRAFYESRFDADFSRTRVHTGPIATKTARSLNARAFTLGRDIFFNSGEFQPGKASGKRLLAHELTHALQQSGRSVFEHGRPEGVRRGHSKALVEVDRERPAPRIQPKIRVGPPEDEFEREADRVAERAVIDPSSSDGPDSCSARDDYRAELQKVDRYKLTLKGWLNRVKRRDLRSDLFSKLRSRRARRVCLAASCDHPDFPVDDILHETKAKLACFDEAYREGEFQGVCKERLGVQCPSGPAPVAPFKRRGEVRRAVKRLDLGRNYQVGAWAEGLIEGLERVKLNLFDALGDLRKLKVDFDKDKLPRRRRKVARFFKDSFGQIEETKLEDVEKILALALSFVERGKVQVTEPPKPNEEEEEEDNIWTKEEVIKRISEGEQPCVDPCWEEAEAGNVANEKFWSCLWRGCGQPEAASEEGSKSEEGSEPSTTSGPSPSPATPSESSATSVFWADRGTEPLCDAAGGFYSGSPAPGKIGVCYETSSGKPDLDRTIVSAILLHELFHKVLGDEDVDVYANSLLFPLMKNLKVQKVPGRQSESGTVELKDPALAIELKDPTLAIRNPDSLTRFVLHAAQIGKEAAVERAKPAAELASGAGTCEVDTVQLAVGMAYQWLRWGELTLVDEDKFGLLEQKYRSEDRQRWLQTVQRMMDVLGKAGHKTEKIEQQPASSEKWQINPSDVPPSLVKPPMLEVAIAGTQVSVRPSGSRLVVTVPQAFLSQPREAQIMQVLGGMEPKPSWVLIDFLSYNREEHPDWKVLDKVGEPSSCGYPLSIVNSIDGKKGMHPLKHPIGKLGSSQCRTPETKA